MICDDLPNKITGRWPVCEGTIVGWYDGYRGKGAAMIQVGDETKGYDIRNLNILEGEMVGSLFGWLITEASPAFWSIRKTAIGCAR